MASITDIYIRYGIPEGLRMHMLRVAGIADQLLSSWHGSSVERVSLMRVLLLHDIGNIVKMDIELGEDQRTRTLCEKYIS